MAGERELRIRIVGDSSSGERALNKTAAAADKVAPKAAVASKALGEVKSHLLNMVPGGNAAQAAFSKVSGGADAAGRGLSGAMVAGTAAAGIALAKFTSDGVQQFVNLASETRSYQRVAGGTAEEASKMVVAFRELGVDIDAGAKGMFRLSREVESGGENLSSFGIEVAKNKDGTTDLNGTLLNIVDAYNRTDDAAKKNAIAFAAFGRAGQTLTPILAKGREGIDELFEAAGKHGEILSQKDLKTAVDFKRSIRDLAEAGKGLEIQLAKGVVPALTDLAHGLTDATDAANKLTSPIGGIGGLGKMLGAATPQSQVKSAWRNFGDILHGHASILDSGREIEEKRTKATKEATEATKGLGDATEDTDSKTEDYTKSVETLADAEKDVTKAKKGREGAAKSVASAQRDEAEANRDLNQLLAAGAVDQEQVASAKQSLAAASKGVQQALRGEADANRGVTQALADQADAQANLDQVKKGADPRDIKKAQLDLNAAKRAEQRAILAVADVKDRETESNVMGVMTTQDLLEKNLDLADAEENVTRASLATQDAQDRLIQLQQQGKEGSKELKDAEELLAEKTQAVADAKNRQADAHDAVIAAQQDEGEATAELQKAQAGDPEFADKVAEARQRVADAHENTVSAIQSETDAIANLNQAEADLETARRQRQADIDASLAANRGQTNFAAARGGLAGPGNAPAPAAGGGILGGLTVTTPLHIDGREFARATATYTADELAKMARRNGLS